MCLTYLFEVWWREIETFAIFGRFQSTSEVVTVHTCQDWHVFVICFVSDARYNVITNQHINRTVAETTRQINNAIDNTQRELQDIRNHPRNPNDLLRLFRYPPTSALSITRAAEIFEQTLEKLFADVHRGAQYNISYTNSEFTNSISFQFWHCQSSRWLTDWLQTKLKGIAGWTPISNWLCLDAVILFWTKFKRAVQSCRLQSTFFGVLVY